MKGLKPEVVLEIKPILEKNLDVVILWMALMNQLDWPSFIVQIEGFRDPFFYLLYAFIDQDSFCNDSYTSVRPVIQGILLACIVGQEGVWGLV